MTLRESEQSLLHNPFHAAPCANAAPGAHKGKRHKRTSKFIPLIAISATCLTATIWFALSATHQFGQGFDNFDYQMTQGFEGQSSYNRGGQNTGHNDHLNAQMRRDVIIKPFGPTFDARLKKLTASQNANTLNPFEIPATRVMDMLAASSDDNISLMPGLKFYPTGIENVIRACAHAVNAFEEIELNNGQRDTSCFTIKTGPVVTPSSRGRRIL